MLVLGTLCKGAQHGHGISQEIHSLSSGTIKIAAGTLYPALHRLERRGWLRRIDGLSRTNQRARFCSLTAAGKAQLLRERRRWSRTVTAIERVMS